MENKKEIWKDIKDYEGLYQISTFGRVRSLSREVESPRQKSYTLKSRILKAGKNKKGYKRYALCKNGKTKTLMAHILVGEAFLGNPDNKNCINHRNSIKDDNYVLNLEWVSHRENNTHRYNKLNTHCKYPGVCRYWGQENKFAIQLNVKKRKITKGPFASQEEAYAEYVKLCKEHGIENNYSLRQSSRKLWNKPYYIKSSQKFIATKL